MSLNHNTKFDSVQHPGSALITRQREILAELDILNKLKLDLLREEWRITGVIPAELTNLHRESSNKTIIQDTSYPLPASLVNSVSSSSRTISSSSNEAADLTSGRCSLQKPKRRMGLRRLTETPTIRKVIVQPEEDDLAKLQLDYALISQIQMANREKAEQTKLDSYRKACLSDARKLKIISQKIENLRNSNTTDKIQIKNNMRTSLSTLNKKFKRNSLIKNLNSHTPMKRSCQLLSHEFIDLTSTKLVSIKRSSSEMFLNSSTDNSDCLGTRKNIVTTRSITQLNENILSKNNSSFKEQKCQSWNSSSGCSTMSSQSSSLSSTCTKSSSISVVSSGADSAIGSFTSSTDNESECKKSLRKRNTINNTMPPITSPVIKEVPISQRIMNKFSKLNRTSIGSMKSRLR